MFLSDFQTDNYLNRLESFEWKEQSKEYQVCKRDCKICRIKFIKDNQIIYSRDGAILRIDQFRDSLISPEILENMQQINCLSWLSQDNQIKKKNQKSIAFWDGVKLMNVGGYYLEKLKQGLWKVLMKNYWNHAQVYEKGEYFNDIKTGQWNQFYGDIKIGGGFYNNEGQKQGKWVELKEGFLSQLQVTYNGEYNKRGIKTGIWDIICYNLRDKRSKYIGGGSYDCQDGWKIGRWVELSDNFGLYSQITYIGDYNKYGQKVGRWDAMYKGYRMKNYKKRGGGLYYNQTGLKFGRWVELWEGFGLKVQVTFKGLYNQKGLKVDKWSIIYLDKQIGGGLYDKKDGQKIGKWTELWKNFQDSAQVTYVGEYNEMTSLKKGRWEIWYKCSKDRLFKNRQIGGGSYDCQEGQKIGKWIEVCDNFYFHSQVTYHGEYNQNGMKIGRWNIYLEEQDREKYKLIGGGQYDIQRSQKVGIWVELDEDFRYYRQVIYIGEYDQKGMKIGRWNIELGGKQIGGGYYDTQQGQKIGKWIELKEESYAYEQAIQKGEYDFKGRKIGQWICMGKVRANSEFKYQESIIYDQ